LRADRLSRRHRRRRAKAQLLKMLAAIAANHFGRYDLVRHFNSGRPNPPDSRFTWCQIVSCCCVRTRVQRRSTSRITKKAGTVITKDEARVAIEARLFAMRLTKPLGPVQKKALCRSANIRLNYQSDTDRMLEIRAWVDSWQELWLPQPAAQ
jgi:hypothetical protein